MTNRNRDPEWLAQERERQIQRLVGRFVVDDEREVEGRNLHLVLGISEVEYIGSIPLLPPQPEQWAGRFDVPILVDPRISLNTWLRLLEFVPIVRYWERAMKSYRGIRIPPVPYWIWTQNGDRYTDVSFSDWWKKKRARDERGATIQEVLFFIYLQEGHLGTHFGGAPGSIVREVVPGRHFGAVMPILQPVRANVSGRMIDTLAVHGKPIDIPDKEIGMLSCGDWTKIKDAPRWH
jgi:hypothetical protein